MTIMLMRSLQSFASVGILTIALAFGAQATPITITPTDAATSGNETSQPRINTAINNFAGFNLAATELYKDNVGGVEEGSLAGSYTTIYTDDPVDPTSSPAGAIITYDGGPFIASDQWLLVKGGAQEPAWYLFDLDGWDGQMTLVLQEFWFDRGAISHVSLYGSAELFDDSDEQTVPEPGMLAVFGVGLAALGLVTRRRRAI